MTNTSAAAVIRCSPTMNKVFYVVVARITDNRKRIVELPLDARDLDGWNEYVRGWSIGPASTNAYIVVEEAELAGVQLGIFPASNHVLLWGHVPEGQTLPQIAWNQGEGWRTWKPMQFAPGRLEFRFDRYPFKIGDHIIQFSYEKPD